MTSSLSNILKEDLPKLGWILTGYKGSKFIYLHQDYGTGEKGFQIELSIEEEMGQSPALYCTLYEIPTVPKMQTEYLFRGYLTTTNDFIEVAKRVYILHQDKTVEKYLALLETPLEKS